jgi:hypothetical protein
MRARHALGVAVCVAALLAGCGGADAGADPWLEYIEKADAVCSGQNKRIQEIGSADHVKKVLIPALVREVRGLRDLVPPASNVRQFKEFLKAMRLMLARAQRNPYWVARSGRPFLRTELMAERYGFAECGHV